MPRINGTILFYSALFLWLVCYPKPDGIAQSESKNEADVDQYSIKLVKALLEQPEASAVSWIEKGQHRLGDRAAIGLLKSVSEHKLLESPTLVSSLRIMRGAFSAPCLIEVPIDREPSVTLFVLRDMERQVKDESIKQKILETMRFVQQSSSTRCDEDKSATGSGVVPPKN
ncbi:MAG TPA: hypothetical protein VK706_14840 [Candidatus Sulfotelmatobacter sp.]|jgi:hypothetical protein|nr:hypothetical protein [Candidatus Sulfotelmatobacter sp.]